MNSRIEHLIVKAGESLEAGDAVYIEDKQAYRIIDSKRAVAGVASKDHKKGDNLCLCALTEDPIDKDQFESEILGIAGEDLIEGGRIEQRPDGRWYNTPVAG